MLILPIKVQQFVAAGESARVFVGVKECPYASIE